ncbi:MAG: hypothetical protein H6719_17595 [Sandaracinaceae bacterium]|nr:hypothetical protein [Sandaracinaceae bacterium]
MSNRGVTCPKCGASTPLPDDLRTPTFECGFCHATLSTAQFAGEVAVSADELIGHMRGTLEEALANPSAPLRDQRTAPKFAGGNKATRDLTCKLCQATTPVPLAMEAHFFHCAACGREQAVAQYVSDRERFELDMARQVAGNEAFKRLVAEGVPCTKCGAMNAVPDDGSVQLPCTSCGATILLSDHVDESAIARQRLKHGAFGLRDEMMARQMAQQSRSKVIVGVVIALLLLGFIVANLVATH